MAENYILIGFTSCGKSSVARALSIELILDFVDLDEEIMALDAMENKQNRSCREIFNDDGEQAFRALESKALASLKQRDKGFILATGGGAPLRTENRQILKELGTIIYLQASPQTIYDRMMIAKGLPAYLKDNPSVEGVSDVLSTRHAEYQSLADICIQTDNLTIFEVKDIVLEQISK